MKLKDKTQIAGIVLSLLMFFTLLNSSYFFLYMMKLSIGKWLSFNACSLVIIVYLICFVSFQITRKDYLLAISLLPLYYYGTMGLFLMPWDKVNTFSQITHVIITMNVLWLLWRFLKERKFESLGKGTLIGILVFVPVFAAIQSYTQSHINEFLQLLEKF